MYKFVCKHCNQDVEVDKPGQVGAHITHCELNPNKGKSYEAIKIIGPELSIKNSKKFREKYYKNPNKCISCNNIIDYENRENKFCNHSCSASYNNKLRLKKERPIKQIRREKVLWNCPVCTRELLLNYAESLKRKYCSGTCRNKINNQLINGSRSKAESMLENALKLEFINIKFLFNSRMILSGNKELDVYIPTLKTAIEWNGIYHYANFRGDEFLQKTQKQDLEKINECKKLGIDLYIVKDLKSSNKFIKQEIEKIINYIKSK